MVEVAAARWRAGQPRILRLPEKRRGGSEYDHRRGQKQLWELAAPSATFDRAAVPLLFENSLLQSRREPLIRDA